MKRHVLTICCVLAVLLATACAPTARPMLADAGATEEQQREALLRFLAEARKKAAERPGGGVPERMDGPMDAEGIFAQAVVATIKPHWRYPAVKPDPALKALIEIAIARDGTITGYHMVESSGREDFDASTLKAIEDTKQLPVPPTEDLRTIQVNFNLQGLDQ
ncbi:TonB family protein [Desulfovibrio sp. X2]|uniref:energy transducer TonB n=1 Tax=Desulfovibrio sp. X2 TaxID=941449 RepID=UPI0003587D35|nr:energy transducer TonB [Desulfovibrio sp. X2]EPR37043.1 TonB family protein [Desulfovibrio sp. X2]